MPQTHRLSPRIHHQLVYLFLCRLRMVGHRWSLRCPQRLRSGSSQTFHFCRGRRCRHRLGPRAKLLFDQGVELSVSDSHLQPRCSSGSLLHNSLLCGSFFFSLPRALLLASSMLLHGDQQPEKSGWTSTGHNPSAGWAHNLGKVGCVVWCCTDPFLRATLSQTMFIEWRVSPEWFQVHFSFCAPDCKQSLEVGGPFQLPHSP